MLIYKPVIDKRKVKISRYNVILKKKKFGCTLSTAERKILRRGVV